MYYSFNCNNIRKWALSTPVIHHAHFVPGSGGVFNTMRKSRGEEVRLIDPDKGSSIRFPGEHFLSEYAPRSCLLPGQHDHLFTIQTGVFLIIQADDFSGFRRP
jgi:hypothetical protein